MCLGRLRVKEQNIVRHSKPDRGVVRLASASLWLTNDLILEVLQTERASCGVLGVAGGSMEVAQVFLAPLTFRHFRPVRTNVLCRLRDESVVSSQPECQGQQKDSEHQRVGSDPEYDRECPGTRSKQNQQTE
jgi:hypothetical protein